MLSEDRERMVATQIEARGITDPLVLDAMRTVPRERFLPAYLAVFAYDDGPLPIGKGQTLSQPYMVAAMAKAVRIKPGERVLEIGTGSGYGAAVLSRIAGEVYTVERIGELAETARGRLAALGYDNVHVREGDGSLGWPERAPYEAILVSAGGPRVPEALLHQMAVGGRLVMPVGPAPPSQRLVRVTRTDAHEYEHENLGVRSIRRIDRGRGLARRRLDMYKHILIPTDGSALSEMAVRQGVAFAKSMQARVTAMTVSIPFHAFALDPVMVSDTPGQYEKDCEALAEKCLGVAKAEASVAGVPCETLHVRAPHPYKAIIDTARKTGSELIFMASHGRKGVSALVLGSETVKVLTHSKIPVLVCR